MSNLELDNEIINLLEELVCPSDRYRLVFKGRIKSILGLGVNLKTLEQLAEELNVTPERVRQMNLKLRFKLVYRLKVKIDVCKRKHVFFNPKVKFEEALKFQISTLELSVRAHNGLSYSQILTLEDLLKHSKADLLRIPNFGKKTVREIELALGNYNLRLGQLKPIYESVKV